MKLAIVVNSFPETSETFIINKVIGLADAGNQVTVVRLQNKGNNALLELYKLNRHKNISILNPYVPYSYLEIFLFAFKRPLIFLQSFSLKLKKLYYNIRINYLVHLFNNNSFEIVHFEFSGLATSFLDVIPKIKCATVMSCRGSGEKVKLLTVPDRAEKFKKTFDVITAIHCVSSDMQQTVTPYCSNQEKIFVNRPAIDTTFFSPQKNKKNCNEVTILSIGRFTFQKGYLIGILAIKRLIEKGYDIRWNIIGDGPLHEEIVFHIHALNLQDNIILHGKKNKNEINECFNTNDIFLLTSVYEGIPNVVLEAMAMELPVVTTKSGGVDEVIEHGKNGLIAPLYNSEEIANLLEQLISSKELALKIGTAARNTIIQDYTIGRQISVFEREYKKIVL